MTPVKTSAIDSNSMRDVLEVVTRPLDAIRSGLSARCAWKRHVRDHVIEGCLRPGGYEAGELSRGSLQYKCGDAPRRPTMVNTASPALRVNGRPSWLEVRFVWLSAAM